MAKAIRWKVPFTSLSGIQYEVDIYDTYAGSVPESWPVTLIAGSVPFTTEEDSSGDIYTPIRTQTATLQICTQLADGSFINMADIMPEDSVTRPVRLVSRPDTPNMDVEWQGFLSCEAYKQTYVGSAQIIQVGVNSITEAWSAISYYESEPKLRTVRNVISNCLRAVTDNYIQSVYDYIYFPYRSWRILNKLIDTTVCNQIMEVCNEFNTTYIVQSRCCNYILETICTYMGWTMREQGRNLYFTDDKCEGYCKVAYGTFIGSSVLIMTRTALTTRNMVNLTWMGDGHNRSVAQGARSVEIVASLEDYNVSTGIPTYCPPDEDSKELIGTTTTYHSEDVLFDNRCTFNNQEYLIDNSGATPYIRSVVDTDPATTHDYSVLHLNTLPETNTASAISRHVGPYMAMIKDTNSATELALTTGVYLSQIEYALANRCGWTPDATNYSLKINSMLRMSATTGTLKVHINGWTLTRNDSGDYYHELDRADYAEVFVSVKVGNRYWDDENEIWSNSLSIFPVSMQEDYEIPIREASSGLVEFTLYPLGMLTGTETYKIELLIRELSLQYIPQDGINTRSENTYSRFTGRSFSDTISITTNLASDMNNHTSPSIVRESELVVMKTMPYIMPDDSIEDRRPEVDLLDRMTAWYSEARQEIELEVSHPTAAALPLLIFNGIGDGKKYLPIAESRDWAEGVSILTCKEIVNP